MKFNPLTFGIIIALVYLFLKQSDGNISSDDEYESSDENISDDEYGADEPSEPSRYYDSKYTRRQEMRINVPTRGEAPSYQQVGILTSTSDGENVKPLYGRQTYRGSNQWNYFTSLDSHLATKIPLSIDSNDCTEERGCKELNKNDTINVNTTDYNVNLYKLNSPRYIP